MLASPPTNVVPLVVARRAVTPASFEALALHTWRLQCELAWAYPRLWYALWAALSTVPQERGGEPAPEAWRPN